MFGCCSWRHLGIQVKIKLRRTGFGEVVGKILRGGDGLAVSLVRGRRTDRRRSVLLSVGMDLETHEHHIVVGEKLFSLAAIGELQPNIQTGAHPRRILAMSFRHSDV